MRNESGALSWSVRALSRGRNLQKIHTSTPCPIDVAKETPKTPAVLAVWQLWARLRKKALHLAQHYTSSEALKLHHHTQKLHSAIHECSVIPVQSKNRSHPVLYIRFCRYRITSRCYYNGLVACMCTGSSTGLSANLKLSFPYLTFHVLYVRTLIKRLKRTH